MGSERKRWCLTTANWKLCESEGGGFQRVFLTRGSRRTQRAIFEDEAIGDDEGVERVPDAWLSNINTAYAQQKMAQEKLLALGIEATPSAASGGGMLLSRAGGTHRPRSTPWKSAVLPSRPSYGV